MALPKFSASSGALDLALSQEPGPDSAVGNGWGLVNRHRTVPSLSALTSQANGAASSAASGQQSSASDVTGVAALPASIRHSLDMKYYAENAADSAAPIMSPPNNTAAATPPKLQTSFSAGDVPTVKNAANGTSALGPNANNHALQYLQNHNASIGRIPTGIMPHRHSRELSTDNTAAYGSIGSSLQANATPFGPLGTQAPPSTAPSAASSAVSSPAASSASQYGSYYGAGSGYSNTVSSPYSGTIPLLAQGLQNMSLGGPAVYSPQNFTGYGSVYGQPTATTRDSQARVIQHRRQMDNEGKHHSIIYMWLDEFVPPLTRVQP